MLCMSDDMDGSFSCDFFDCKFFVVAVAWQMLKVLLNTREGRLSGTILITLHIAQNTRRRMLQIIAQNKLAKSHIEFQRHKMNVRVASKTLSSSVADALEYLMPAGNPDFANADGTIDFIRTLDRLFDLMNARSPFRKGYRRPFFLHDMKIWQKLLEVNKLSSTT